MKALQASHYTLPLHLYLSGAITAPQNGLDSKDFWGAKFGKQFFVRNNMESENVWQQILGGNIWGANSFE